MHTQSQVLPLVLKYLRQLLTPAYSRMHSSYYVLMLCNTNLLQCIVHTLHT